MKTLIYELYSGVGLCNQLFSFETAIYLANIMNRKLILIIKHPLCHCGKSSWEYGYFMNFFTSDFHRFLPNGFEVYYKEIPAHLIEHTANVHNFSSTEKFSNIVFVDQDLMETTDKDILEEFCHQRKHISFCANKYEEEFIYITNSNASRCFYNFYTSSSNYQLMYAICGSIRFKSGYHDIAETVYSRLNEPKSFIIFTHARFGDTHKDKTFIERQNSLIIDSLSTFITAHKTCTITPKLYALIDNKTNTVFNTAMEKHKIIPIETHTNDLFKPYSDNPYTISDFQGITRYDVATAIVEMILATKANEFIGYVSSTFSHYIQYLRYRNDKSHSNYLNITNKNVQQCKLTQINDSNFQWGKLGFMKGHPVSWHYFFDPFPNLHFNHKLLSIAGKTDGFGSQLQACFSLIAYCHFKEYEYIHTTFQKMHHNDEKLQNFPELMSNFVNLDNLFRNKNTLSSFEESILQKAKEGDIVHGSYCPEYFYNDTVLNKLRICYYSSSKPDLTSIYNLDKFNVAIHIRRGDVSEQRYPNRFISNQTYINLLSAYEFPENTQLHIFSEGVSTDFQSIIDRFPDIKLHLSINIENTFHSLVKADLLILSKSSFSYCAALLNNNIINATLIEKWWHKPLKSWKLNTSLYK
jgi:hypothetical protein